MRVWHRHTDKPLQQLLHLARTPRWSPPSRRDQHQRQAFGGVQSLQVPVEAVANGEVTDGELVQQPVFVLKPGGEAFQRQIVQAGQSRSGNAHGEGQQAAGTDDPQGGRPSPRYPLRSDEAAQQVQRLALGEDAEREAAETVEAGKGAAAREDHRTISRAGKQRPDLGLLAHTVQDQQQLEVGKPAPEHGAPVADRHGRSLGERLKQAKQIVDQFRRRAGRSLLVTEGQQDRAVAKARGESVAGLQSERARARPWRPDGGGEPAQMRLCGGAVAEEGQQLAEHVLSPGEVVHGPRQP